ncbi:hypothetical protein AB7W42_19115 [Providencia rettgeri]
MRYTYTIGGFNRNQGSNPDIRFVCSDCGQPEPKLLSYFYRARLEYDIKADLEAACAEFVKKINEGKITELFFKVTTVKACHSVCCNCENKQPKARGFILSKLEKSLNGKNGEVAK